MNNKNLLVIMIFFVVLFNSIVYSALNSSMFINGDANIRVDKDIRITDLKVLDQVNGAYETYNSDYSKNTISMQVSIPSSESIMIYEITITNKGDTDYEVTNIVEESYSNGNIKYELIDIEKGTVIDKMTTHTFKIKFTTTENNSDNKTTLVLKYDFKEWRTYLYNMVANSSISLDTNIDFSIAPTIDTSGVYEMNSTKDLEYPVYYYRGIIDNNNVNFAGFCWKIVRTTETGGVKLIYNGIVGSDGSCNNTGDKSVIANVQYNISCGNKNDVSYIYDNGSDSKIKKTIDDWYFNNMIDYTNMLEDTIWCNDRSTNSTGNTYIQYGPPNRLSNPSIICPSDADKLTIKNGKLKYPIAMLTIEEATLAGQGIYGYNKEGYLNINKPWWSLSPNFFAGSWARVFPITGAESTSNDHTNQTNGCRPSISLTNKTIINRGQGTVTNPFEIF